MTEGGEEGASVIPATLLDHRIRRRRCQAASSSRNRELRSATTARTSLRRRAGAIADASVGACAQGPQIEGGLNTTGSLEADLALQIIATGSEMRISGPLPETARGFGPESAPTGPRSLRAPIPGPETVLSGPASLCPQ